MKQTFFTFALVFFINITFGQNQISASFSESYSHEYNKEYKKAIETLDKIYDANSYEINLRLGWLNYLNGDFVKSKNYYSNAMKLKPKSIEAKLGYAYPAAATESWDDLLKLYKNLVLSRIANEKCKKLQRTGRMGNGDQGIVRKGRLGKNSIHAGVASAGYAGLARILGANDPHALRHTCRQPGVGVG